MNTVTVASAVEPHLVTMVTNNTSARAGDTAGGGCNVGVPTLVTNSLMGGGRTNPAGPQLEEEQLEVEVMGGGDGHLNLLNFSPDEHEPLLRREQPLAESEPRPPPHQGRGSNSNNNNNRVALGSEVSDLSPTSGPTSTPKAPPTAQDTGPCLQKAPVAEHPGPDPQTTTAAESSSPEPATLRVSALDHVGQSQASRPPRPSSLDLSSSCMSSGESHQHGVQPVDGLLSRDSDVGGQEAENCDWTGDQR